MHINLLREARRKEIANRDVELQSTSRYEEECGECKTITLSADEVKSMVKRARKPPRKEVPTSIF